MTPHEFEIYGHVEITEADAHQKVLFAKCRWCPFTVQYSSALDPDRLWDDTACPGRPSLIPIERETQQPQSWISRVRRKIEKFFNA